MLVHRTELFEVTKFISIEDKCEVWAPSVDGGPQIELLSGAVSGDVVAVRESRARHL